MYFSKLLFFYTIFNNKSKCSCKICGLIGLYKMLTVRFPKWQKRSAPIWRVGSINNIIRRSWAIISNGPIYGMPTVIDIYDWNIYLEFIFECKELQNVSRRNSGSYSWQQRYTVREICPHKTLHNDIRRFHICSVYIIIG